MIIFIIEWCITVLIKIKKFFQKLRKLFFFFFFQLLFDFKDLFPFFSSINKFVSFISFFLFESHKSLIHRGKGKIKVRKQQLQLLRVPCFGGSSKYGRVNSTRGSVLDKSFYYKSFCVAKYTICIAQRPLRAVAFESKHRLKSVFKLTFGSSNRNFSCKNVWGVV